MRLRTTRRFAFGSALAATAAGLAILAPASSAGASTTGANATGASVTGAHTVRGAHSVGGGLMIRRGEGGFTIENEGSGLCLDIPDGSKKTNVAVQLWGCNGNLQQEWAFVNGEGDNEWEIQNVASKLCLAPYDDEPTSALVQWGCDASDNYELWDLGAGSWWQIRNFVGGYVAYPAGCDATYGVWIYQGGDCGHDLTMWG
jgi:Ricin-type beta-trefoil lectin domain-like